MPIDEYQADATLGIRASLNRARRLRSIVLLKKVQDRTFPLRGDVGFLRFAIYPPEYCLNPAASNAGASVHCLHIATCEIADALRLFHNGCINRLQHSWASPPT